MLNHLMNQIVAEYKNYQEIAADLYSEINNGRYPEYREAQQKWLDALEVIELYGWQRQAGVKYFNMED